MGQDRVTFETPKESVSMTEEQKALFAEQVRHLYGNALVGLIATAVNSLALVAIQRNVTSQRALIAWLTLVLLISLPRYIEIRRFPRKEAPGFSEAKRWSRRFIIGLALSGVVWGSAAFFLFPIESLAHQTFLAFVIGGMVAGAAATFSIVIKAFFAYSVPALTPIIVRFALLGDELHIAMAGMVLLFGIMMVFVAKRVNTITVTSLKLRFENRGLVSYLRAAKENADRINSELLSKIDESERLKTELQRSEGRLRRLTTELLNTQERERRLVAQEIHDSMAGSLSAAKFKVESGLKELGNMNPQTISVLEGILATIKATIEEAKRIQMALRPSILDDLGILATISWFSRQFESTYSNILIIKEIEIRENEVSDNLKTVIFRVLQEALNNVAKHSKANEVLLVLRRADRVIHLGIRDNGQGFDPAEVNYQSETSRGLGLESMRERVELSGGCFSIETSKGAGTLIQALWPIDSCCSQNT